MYDNIKSCISVNRENSDFFYSNIGLRRGENLSLVLFSIFLNDLEHYLLNNSDINLRMNISTSKDHCYFICRWYSCFCTFWKGHNYNIIR